MTLSIHAALTALPVRNPERAKRKGRSARFALELAAGQTPAQITTAVLSSLGDFGPVVAPISPLDQGVQILTLNTRTLDGAEPAAAFAAGYALADEFRLASAEPDLPTAFYPETELPVEFDLPVPEALDFPPGCWTPSENQLSATWALDAMRVPQAWQFSADQGRPAGGAGVVIAQPDTGITKHAELLDVTTSGGWDVIDNDDDPTDKRTLADRLGLGNPGHGTGTASVVVSRPAHVVTGSAPAATHMPIRAVESVVRIQQVSVAQAINRAVDHGAHVITMSLGGVPAEVLHRAIRRAVAADVIVLAAAGNCVRTVVWPARYDEVIAVAGTNADDAMWRGTCRGAAVDISAPGQNVRKASVPGSGPIGDAVGQGQGTSFAVALTAGVAALWLAHRGRPDLVAAARARGENLQQMFRRLVQASARKPANWNSFELGAGIVDARALLEIDLDAGLDRESAAPPTPAETPEVTVAGLVAETVGLDAARDDELDWGRYGPEIAYVLLDAQLNTPGESGVTQPENARAVPDISDDLADAISNPLLRNWFQLPGV